MTIRLRLLLAFTAITFAAACRPPERLEPYEPRRAPSAAEAPAREVRVGAWNIEWLGSPDRRSGPAKGHAQQPEDLAEYILAGNVGVLGLIEIADDSPDGSGSNSTLRRAFELVEQRGGGRWSHRLFPARSGRNQNCGLAWDAAKVTPVGTPQVVTTPATVAGEEGPIWSRPPYAQTFSAGTGLTDFVVIVIHMKSNYGGDFASQRDREAQALVADLPKAVSDGDVLIIGDANCSDHGEPAVQTIQAAGFVDLNRADAATHLRWGPLDRAFVPQTQAEFAPRHFEVVGESFTMARGLSTDEFRVRFSDHQMIVTRVRVLPDDD